MTRLTLFATLIVMIAGCASNGTEAPVQGAGDVAQTDASAATKPEADSAEAAEEIEFMDAPEVAQVAAVSETRDEMICVRVALTGTHIMEKICRPRSEIEAIMRDTQQAVRQMEMGTSNSGAPKN